MKKKIIDKKWENENRRQYTEGLVMLVAPLSNSWWQLASNWAGGSCSRGRDREGVGSPSKTWNCVYTYRRSGSFWQEKRNTHSAHSRQRGLSCMSLCCCREGENYAVIKLDSPKSRRSPGASSAAPTLQHTNGRRRLSISRPFLFPSLYMSPWFLFLLPFRQFFFFLGCCCIFFFSSFGAIHMYVYINIYIYIQS